MMNQPTLNQQQALATARDIMEDFTQFTGVVGDEPPRRYLWTDAFAVCNFLELYRQTQDAAYKRLALRLVDQVHHVLGRHRDDDARVGWISGLDEEEGEAQPTLGGLRIGKSLNERPPGEPINQRQEWDRDGQYYHYLTKWMHALNRVGQVTGEAAYHLWAMELAKTAHAAFTYAPARGGSKRMYWKMSIDLSRPLVPSMGQHDPLDGLITYEQLRATVPQTADISSWPNLESEVADMAEICANVNWVTDDGLGIGGLLSDAYRLAQLIAYADLERGAWLATLMDAAQMSLRAFTSQGSLQLPVNYRLAFRELGLSIGLRAVQRLRGLIEDRAARFEAESAIPSSVEALKAYAPLTSRIERFWLDPVNQEAESWTAHHDINMVMLATSLAPDGYLKLF
jgi:hypothetical protein